MAESTKSRFAFTVEVTYRIPVEVDAEDMDAAKDKVLDMWAWGQIQPDPDCDQVENLCATPEGWRYGDPMRDVLLMPDFRERRIEL